MYHQGKIHDIEMVQRHADDSSAALYRLDASIESNLLSKLNYPSLQERRKAAWLKLVCKIINKHATVNTGHLLQTPAFITISATKDFYTCSFPRTKKSIGTYFRQTFAQLASFKKPRLNLHYI